MPLENPLDCFLQTGDVLHVAPDGQMRTVAVAPRGLFPGSFNPLHRAHLELIRLAEQLLGHPIAFELSVANVDKPRLTREEVRRRLTQFSWRASVWLTHAPRFVEKSLWFPDVTFVVGTDTALRIVLPAYYNNDEEQMLIALRTIAGEELPFFGCLSAQSSRRMFATGRFAYPRRSSGSFSRHSSGTISLGSLLDGIACKGARVGRIRLMDRTQEHVGSKTSRSRSGQVG